MRWLCIAVLAAAPALAQTGDAERARALFEQGVAAAEREHWTEAVELFRQSRDQVDRPGTEYNLAFALSRLGRLREASAALTAYFAIAGADDSRRAEAQSLQGELATRMGSVHLAVEPASARVEIDGAADPGTGPTREIAVDPGQHRIVVSAPGFASQELTIDTARERVLTRDVHLASGGSGSGGGIGSLGIVGLVVGGVGAAAGLAALFTGIASSSTYDGLVARCGPGGTSCPPGSESDISTGNALAWTSTILLIAGAAALATGATLLVIDLASGSGSARSARLELMGSGARLRF